LIYYDLFWLHVQKNIARNNDLCNLFEKSKNEYTAKEKANLGGQEGAMRDQDQNSCSLGIKFHFIKHFLLPTGTGVISSA